MKTCIVYYIPLIISIIFFLWNIMRYIYYRYIFFKYIKILDGDERWDETYVNINKWLEYIKTDKDTIEYNHYISSKKSHLGNSINNNNTLPCQNMALYVPRENISIPSICRKMSRDFCGVDSRSMKLVNIPHDKTFIAASGMHLLPGESYCVYKKPPISNDDRNCNETWGFWKYSPTQDMWRCHSKVPGIYDAERDKFNPCQREDKNGKFTIDNVVFSPDEIEKNLNPSDFYSMEFQLKCGCLCDKQKGYIFNPKLSRTSCYKDPCLTALPPFSAADGYDLKTGNCNCGSYFTNMFDDKRQPCTACPYNRPSYDPKTKIMTIYIKCFKESDIKEIGNNPNKNINNIFGIFPCVTEEDKIRGCTKAVIRVNPNKNGDFASFYDRVFW